MAAAAADEARPFFWPYTLRMLLRTKLPIVLIDLIANLVYDRRIADMLSKALRKMIMHPSLDNPRPFLTLAPGKKWRRCGFAWPSRGFICDAPFTFVNFNIGGKVAVDCCKQRPFGHITMCSTCGITICQRCWHRLAHQRCVCADPYMGANGLYNCRRKRILKYFRRGE